MTKISYIIQLLGNGGIFYWGTKRIQTQQSNIYIMILLFNILFNIANAMYNKQTIKKEILMDSVIRSSVAFTTCILILSLINQYNNDKIMIVFIMAVMLLTLYFLNKYYIFSR